MLDTLLTFAAETAGHEEPSKTAFYIAGGVLAAWAVVLSAIGLSRADWPSSDGPARGVMAITAVLVVATMASAVATG